MFICSCFSLFFIILSIFFHMNTFLNIWGLLFSKKYIGEKNLSNTTTQKIFFHKLSHCIYVYKKFNKFSLTFLSNINCLRSKFQFFSQDFFSFDGITCFQTILVFGSSSVRLNFISSFLFYSVYVFLIHYFSLIDGL